MSERSWRAAVVLTAVLGLSFRASAFADVPGRINFQGRIELPEAELEADEEAKGQGEKGRSESKPFTGTGLFKFAIVSDTGAVVWTNVAGDLTAPPLASVSIPVRDGIFNVALGDPALGMPPIAPGVFAAPDRSLRVFFKGEVRDKKGRLKKTTPERELLPPQRLLSVPFAFMAARAQEAEVSKTAIEALLAGATVQGNFAIAQNAVVLGSATVLGQVTAKGGVRAGGTVDTGSQPNTLAFTPSAGPFGIIVVPANEFAPFQIGGGGSLDIEAASGLFLNRVATGPVSLAAGGGNVLVSTPVASGRVGIGTDAPLAKLHVSSGAGEAGDILVVSTGASSVFRVSGQGEVRANKYFGDGSALTGVAAGGVPQEAALSTINAPAVTPFGGVHVASNLFVSRGNLAIGTTAQDAVLNIRGGAGAGLAPDGFPVVARIGAPVSPVGLDPWTILFDDPEDPLQSFALFSGFGFFGVQQSFLQPTGFPRAGFPAMFITQNQSAISGSQNAQLSGEFSPNARFSQRASVDASGGSAAVFLSASRNDNLLGESRGASLSVNAFSQQVTIGGSLVVSGSKSSSHEDPDDPTRRILLYALEGPEVGTYARGTARLERGEALILLPETFVKATSAKAPVTAQVTPLDECNGLRVVSKNSREFVVREMGGGRSNASFDWLIQGVRAGFEDAASWQEAATAEPQAMPEPMPLPRRGSGRKR